jgi:hypothetical protein
LYYYPFFRFVPNRCHQKLLVWPNALSSRSFASLGSLSFPLWIVMWGTLFEHTTGRTPYAYVEMPEWQFQAMWVIVVIQLLMNIGCLVYFEGVRLSVLTLGLVQGFLTFIALFVASMSIRGEWL